MLGAVAAVVAFMFSRERARATVSIGLRNRATDFALCPKLSTRDDQTGRMTGVLHA